MRIATTRKGARIATAMGAALTAAALLLAPAIPASATPAADPGDTTVGVATRPAGDDGLPDDRTRFSYTADPGQTVTDRVYIGNTGTERQDFTVYATDGFNTDTGEFALLATDEQPSGIGAWVRFENGEDRIRFALEPDEARLLSFTVTFPADATPGDHVGGLVASVLEDGAQVSLDRRVATAIYARVSGELQPRLTISNLRAEHRGDWWNPFGGTVVLDYTIDNPGNVALAANLTAGARTFFWIPVTGEKGGRVPVLLPGNSASYRLELSGVGQWLYLDPFLTIRPFADTDDKDAQLLQVAPTSRDVVLIVPPWTVILALALVVGVVLFIRWRRKRQDQQAIAWMEETEKRAREEAEAALADGPAVPRDSEAVTPG
ncbi:MAG: hypothetical protein QM598_12490 [Protaetiibacter sp.]